MAGVHRETREAITKTTRDRMTTNPLYGKDLLSIKECSLAEIELILDTAERIKSQQIKLNLNNKIMASCFFEASTRTRLSFESASLRSGGNVIGFSNDSSLSTKKGESLQDTIRVMSDYADVLVIRHPKEGSARLAADIAKVPVINAGDGANQHPTQTLIDLFSIRETQGQLNDLSVAVVGDLKYGRTVHSLVQACQLFNIRLYLVAPESLSLPEAACDYLKRKSVSFSFHRTLDEIMHKVDIIYMTRVQKERLGANEGETSIRDFTLTTKLLEKAKPTLKVLHPLPRVDEVDVAVDSTPFAYYFEQAANGVFVRQAILSLILNKDLP